MREELIDLLTSYLLNWKTIEDCAAWFASVSWDGASLIDAYRKSIGLLELLATEVLEGMRPESDFADEAARMVQSETNSFFIKRIDSGINIISSSTNSSTNVPKVVVVGEVVPA